MQEPCRLRTPTRVGDLKDNHRSTRGFQAPTFRCWERGTTGRNDGERRREKRDLACPQVPSLPGGDITATELLLGARVEFPRLVQPSTYDLFRGVPPTTVGLPADCRTHRLPACGLQFMYPNLPRSIPTSRPAWDWTTVRSRRFGACTDTPSSVALLHHRPIVEVVLTVTSGSPLLVRELIADTGAATAQAGFELLLQDNDCLVGKDSHCGPRSVALPHKERRSLQPPIGPQHVSRTDVEYSALR